MAWTVETAFEQFFTGINLPGEHRTTANSRKDWIVRRLSGRLTILDSFPMGSIPRFTALKGYADLDIIVVLDHGQHIGTRKPSTVLWNVRSALGEGAGSIRRNGQAVTMKFLSWPDVDVVPAARFRNSDGTVSHYEIPDMNQEKWIRTNPHTHSSDMADAASRRGPNFRKVIKMLKDWNRRQEISIQSYHLEVIALRLNTDWTDIGWAVYQWFKAAAQSMHTLWHEGADITSYLSPTRAQAAVTQIRPAETAAMSGWYRTSGMNNDHRGAIAEWRKIFGSGFPVYG